MIALSFLTSACCTPTAIPEIVSIPILPMPVLPPLTNEQKNAIAADTFITLVERETRLKLHIEKVNAIIKLTESK
ncbi:MAG: hypothetical protein GY810_29635 [Aureispira sp.]|nr:hypothetical protein [Aureispira sp.]